jgi:hypothetical protein
MDFILQINDTRIVYDNYLRYVQTNAGYFDISTSVTQP